MTKPNVRLNLKQDCLFVLRKNDGIILLDRDNCIVKQVDSHTINSATDGGVKDIVSIEWSELSDSQKVELQKHLKTGVITKKEFDAFGGTVLNI